MSYESYPSTLLPNPQVNFRGAIQQNVIRTKMDSGRYRARRRFTRELREYRVSWQFSDDQYGVFQSWLLHKLNGGADWFNISLPLSGQGFQTVLARISEGQYTASHENVLYWVVSAALEVEETDVLSEGTFDALLVAGDIDDLEAAVAHVEEFVES